VQRCKTTSALSSFARSIGSLAAAGSCLTQSMPIDSPTVRASSAVKLARSPI